MALNRLYFSGFEKAEKQMRPKEIDRIDFTLYLYLQNGQICHVHYATLYSRDVAFLQYTQTYSPFESFMEDLMSYGSDDELIIYISINGGTFDYASSKWREHVWVQVCSDEFFKLNIDALVLEKTKHIESSIGIIQSEQEFRELVHEYVDALFGIKNYP